MIEVEADQRSFDRAARALSDESDGRELRRDLAADLRDAVQPIVDEQRARVMAIHSGGLPHDGEPLREAVAAGVHTDIRFGGHSAGVRIRASSRGMPRNFRTAPKRLNQSSWIHRVFGRDVWVEQVGAPNWFDEPPQRHQSRARRAVERAIEKSIRRVSRRS